MIFTGVGGVGGVGGASQALRPVGLRVLAALTGLAAAVAVRVAVAGSAGARSVGAGVVFAALVAGLAWLLARRPVTPSHSGRWAAVRDAGVGLAGAAVLCVPAALRHLDGWAAVLPLHAYLPWAAGVTLVAIAEESLLRGSLFTMLQPRVGTAVTIAVTSLAFAVLHLPLYGTKVFVLDLAVGVWLGALRAVSGSVTAPAVAHTVADLAGWFLR